MMLINPPGLAVHLCDYTEPSLRIVRYGEADDSNANDTEA